MSEKIPDLSKSIVCERDYINILDNAISDAFSFELYLKTGKALYRYKNWPVVLWRSFGRRRFGSDANIIADNVVYICSMTDKITAKSLQESEPHAVIVPFKKEKLFLLNGDRLAGNFFGDRDSFKAITVSFTCIARFYGDLNVETQSESYQIWDTFLKRLVDGSIAVLDYTEDETRPLNAADRRKVHNRKGHLLTPPESGFTLVGENWHRAASVLFYDKEENKTFLIGQDEGTYFGCLLAGKPKTIQAAFIDLIPKSIREIPGVKRQGEWFIVPCDEADVPAVKDCIAEGSVSLPRDHENSARHTIGDDARVAKDGTIYALETFLAHSNGDHSDVDWEGWVYFVKNTALESYSVEGVD